MKAKNVLILLGKAVVSMLVVYSLILIAGFIFVKYGITNTEGKIDENSSAFQENEEILNDVLVSQAPSIPTSILTFPKAEDSLALKEKRKNFCRLQIISTYSPENSRRIIQVYKKYNDNILANKMIFAASLKLDKVLDFKKQIKLCEQEDAKAEIDPDKLLLSLEKATSSNLFIWLSSEEWDNMREALTKDSGTIISAASTTNVEPRLLVAITIVEQLRMYYTQREVYKKFFAPLKILGNATKFSLGIMNIKEKTAIEIESHLKDKASPYYLGPTFENILDFKSTSTAAERYSRLTNEKNHYYSYLYGALYIKQIMLQWQRAGFDISKRPEIISTLFNVGFKNSHPKPKPEVGGAEIEIGGIKYSFGSLAYEFYYSGEMVEEFGYSTN